MMNRRSFLIASIETSLAAYFTCLGKSWSQEISHDPGSLGTMEGGPLGPVSAYLQEYRGPSGSLDSSKVQTLSFDWVQWKTNRHRQVPLQSVVGELKVQRDPLQEDNHIVYTVRQTLGQGEHMEGVYHCLRDKWLSLARWDIKVHLESGSVSIDPMTRIQEKGTREKDTLILERDGGTERIACPGPLICRWGLLDGGRVLNSLAASNASVFLLKEPSGILRNQHFFPAETLSFPGAREETISTFLQTGPGCLPTHWILDEQHRPLFVTVFLLSLVLKEITSSGKEIF